jgi:hypothetical protein
MIYCHWFELEPVIQIWLGYIQLTQNKVYWNCTKKSMVLYIYLTKKGGAVATVLNGWFSQDSIPYVEYFPPTIWTSLASFTVGL